MLTLSTEGGKKVHMQVQAILSAGGWGCLHLPFKGGAGSERSETRAGLGQPPPSPCRLFRKPLGQEGVKIPRPGAGPPDGALAWHLSPGTEFIAPLWEHLPGWATRIAPLAALGQKFPHKTCFTFFLSNRSDCSPALSHSTGVRGHSNSSSSSCGSSNSR